MVASSLSERVLSWDQTPFDPSLSQLHTLVNRYDPTTPYIASTEPNVSEKLEPLKRRLRREGIRVPRTIISTMNPVDIEECMMKAENLVSKANVVCISGGPNSIGIALAVTTTNLNKMMFHVVDPRTAEERMANPFQILKVVDIWPEGIRG